MNKEKFDEIIDALVNKTTRLDDLINHLSVNVFRNTDGTFTHDDSNNNILSKNLRGEASKNFIAYFLNLIHDEGNRYLPPKTSQNVVTEETGFTQNNNTTRNKMSQNNGGEFNQHNGEVQEIGEQKKLFLKPMKQSNSPKIYQNFIDPSAPVNNCFSNKGRKSNHFIASPTNGTTTGIINPYSPKTNTYANKTHSKPTLFDYFQTPIKSPNNETTKGINSPVIVSNFSTKLKENLKSDIPNFSSRFKTNGETSRTSPKITLTNEQPVDNKFDRKIELKRIEPVETQTAPKVEETAVKKENVHLGECVRNKLALLDKEKMSLISKFYTQMILSNLVITINTELFFLFQLITLNPSEDKNENVSKNFKLFTSIESCIYFAIESLNNLECVLKYLKYSTLVELTKNVYIKSFSDVFVHYSSILNNETSKEEIKQKSKLVFLELKVIPFNAGTNTLENYHDKYAFISFKNQRDEFYDMLWQWEKNHKLENWNFADLYGEKIRYLVSFKENMANFLQFVKLFQDQLVLMCKDDKLLIDNTNDDDLSTGFNQIKIKFNDPLKLKKLNARMSTPNPHYGPNPAPKFTGYQEFFKDFIDLSHSPVFHQTLKDSICREIDLIHGEIPDFENINESTIDKDALEEMLLKLRILGKFLGYLVFYPYQYSVSSAHSKELVLLRNNKLMPLNLEIYLEKAIAKRHLILTIPFVVEFLSMMDENAFLIESVKYSFSLLILIFNSKIMLINSQRFTTDKFLLLLCISWLFQLKKINYNQFKPDYDKVISSDDSNSSGLDNYSFVTSLVLHVCCPYLDELQKMLTRFSTGVKKGCQNIKDLSHLFTLESPPEAANNRQDNNQIQIQLINQFFFLHPAHKRLVEFVAESLHSSFVKHYRQSQIKHQEFEQLAKIVQTLDLDDKNKEFQDTGNDYLKNFTKQISNECLSQGKEYFKPKISALIENSLGESECSQVLEQTKKICFYKTVEKLKTWLNANLNEKKLLDELKNKNKKPDAALTINANQTEISDLLPMKNNDTIHFNVSDIFKEIKKTMRNLLNKQEDDFDKIESHIQDLFSQLLTFLKENDKENKQLKPIREFISQITTEIIFFYVCNCDKQPIKREIMHKYASISQEIDCNIKQKISTILNCPRNIYLLNNKIKSNYVSENLKTFANVLKDQLKLDDDQIAFLIAFVN